MVQGKGLFVVVERAISVNRPLRTRTVGGVGAGGEKTLATRLERGVKVLGFTIGLPSSEYDLDDGLRLLKFGRR